MEWQGHLHAVGLQCVAIFPVFFSGSLMFGEYVDVFDGIMIVLAMYTLNIFHPGIYLRGEDYPSQTSSEGVVMEDRLKPAYSQGMAV
jgi:hypothetical protein